MSASRNAVELEEMRLRLRVKDKVNSHYCQVTTVGILKDAYGAIKFILFSFIIYSLWINRSSLTGCEKQKSIQGHPGKSPAIVNKTRTVCVTSM